jgi:uncharacterized protein YicC (UPF0701 family)
MALSSMTGFARGHGVAGSYAWSWELKTVNAKGLDLRLRLPPGWDAIEVPARTRATEKLSRGTAYANLTVERKGVAPAVKVNEPVLAAVLATLKGLRGVVDASPPTLDGILMRCEEGATLSRLLAARLDEIAALAARAEAAPGRKPEAIKARLAEQVATLLATSARFDSDRLHQEAIMLASKADIREELDRLASHVEQARKLIAGGGAVGRRLDFLAQELNRESNTLTAKANDVDLTNIGLELKSAIEQFREQVQNLE